MQRRMLLTAWIASHSETPMAQQTGKPICAAPWGPDAIPDLTWEQVRTAGSFLRRVQPVFQFLSIAPDFALRPFVQLGICGVQPET
jgi:hypothetical protein